MVRKFRLVEKETGEVLDKFKNARELREFVAFAKEEFGYEFELELRKGVYTAYLLN